jgi:hypothetical protein
MYIGTVYQGKLDSLIVFGLSYVLDWYHPEEVPLKKG